MLLFLLGDLQCIRGGITLINRSISFIMASKKHRTESITASLEPVYQLWGWVLLAWSLYRYFVRGMPEWVDELVAKPLVFVVPVLWFVVSYERRHLTSVGITTRNLFNNIYIGLGFGILFAIEGIAANAIKYGKLDFKPIATLEENGLILLVVLSFATAFSEELLNRGFLFSRILEKTRSLPYAALLSTVLFILLHVPIVVTMLQLTGMTLVLFFLTDFVLGLANALLYFNTKSLVTPILVHLFWNMTVALYL